jgi:hypothetical protein
MGVRGVRITVRMTDLSEAVVGIMIQEIGVSCGVFRISLDILGIHSVVCSDTPIEDPNGGYEGSKYNR